MQQRMDAFVNLERARGVRWAGRTRAVDTNQEAAIGTSSGPAKITVLVGRHERDLDERSLKEAVEQSDEESLVTVHIQMLEGLSTRLDAFLAESIPIMSRSSLTRIIRADCVTVNGKLPKASTKLKKGDDVIVNLPPPPSTNVEGEDIPLDILLEDKHVILVNKQVCSLKHLVSDSAVQDLVLRLASKNLLRRVSPDRWHYEAVLF